MTQNQPGTSVPAVTPIVIPCSDLGHPILSVFSDDWAAWAEIDRDRDDGPFDASSAVIAVHETGERLHQAAKWDMNARVSPGETFATHRSNERWLELLDVCLADLQKARDFFHAEVNGSNEKGEAK